MQFLGLRYYGKASLRNAVLADALHLLGLRRYNKAEGEIFVRERLLAMADKKYAAFHGHLLPAGTPVIGVRMPLLKKIAKEITADKSVALEFLAGAADYYYEERVLQGLVIAGLKLEAKEQLKLIRCFLPKINNWAVCDSFCAALKNFRGFQKNGWKFLLKCLKSKRTYIQRFGIVMVLDYYADEEHMAEALAIFNQLDTDEYYVEMAIAWAVSVFFVRDFAQTFVWFADCNISERISRMVVQKCCDSRRITGENKLRLRELLRSRRNCEKRDV